MPRAFDHRAALAHGAALRAEVRALLDVALAFGLIASVDAGAGAVLDASEHHAS